MPDSIQPSTQWVHKTKGVKVTVESTYLAHGKTWVGFKFGTGWTDTMTALGFKRAYRPVTE